MDITGGVVMENFNLDNIFLLEKKLFLFNEKIGPLCHIYIISNRMRNLPVLKVIYLRHAVSKEGFQMNNIKIKAICKWTVLCTIIDVCKFLSFANYYRRFMKGYTKIISPLYTLISGDNACKKGKLVNWT